MIEKDSTIPGDLQLNVPLETDNRVALKTVYTQKLIVVKFLRKFSSPYTRFEAKELFKHYEEFEKLGVDLIAVSFDEAGIIDFIIEDIWKGPLYLDPKKELYEFLELKTMKKMDGARCLFSSKSKKFVKSSLKNKKRDLQKESLQMGGTFVINSSGTILYSFYQTNFNDFPCCEEILTACRNEIAIRPLPKPVVKPEPEKTLIGKLTSDPKRNLPPLDEGGARISQTWAHLDLRNSKVVSRLFAWDKTLSFAPSKDKKNSGFFGKSILE